MSETIPVEYVRMPRFVWFEFWTEWWINVEDTPEFLILGCKSPNEYQIYDAVAGTVIFESQTYDEARYWLSEDEYSPVQGRVEVESE